MPRRCFLQAVGSGDHALGERWLESHPELLREVRSPKTPQAIATGDLLVYYAAGHQRIVAIARASEPGRDAQLDVSGGDDILPYVTRVQVLLAVPTLALSPSSDVLGLPSGAIMGMSHLELTSAQYEAAWNAIVGRTRPPA